MTISLPSFEYLRPETLDEATRTLSDFGSSAVVLAGGTDLIPNLKRRQVSVGTVVSLGAIEEMRGIRTEDDGTVVVGASTSLYDLAGSKKVPGALADAAAMVGSPQIRNVATVGGNLCLDTRCNYMDMPQLWREASGPCLKGGGDVCWVAPRSDRCWAICSSDLVPVSIALGGEVRVVSSRGQRTIAVEDLWTNDGIDYLTKEPDEIIVELTIPRVVGRRVAYQKLRRRGSIDFPILGVAASVVMDESAMVADARIVLGAVAPAPLRASEAELFLEGAALTSESIDEAARLAARIVRPQDNADLGSRYRKWMASVHVARTLQELVHQN